MQRLLAFFFACFLTSFSFSQTVTTRSLSGVNYQTSVSYAFVAADSTRVTVFNNAAAIAATLGAGTSNPAFGAGSDIAVSNLGIGTVTITCTACTINGVATLALATGQSADIYGDGTNYVTIQGGGGGGGGTGCVVNPADGGCAINGNPSVDVFIGGVGAGTGWVMQWLTSSANLRLPLNITATNCLGGSPCAGIVTYTFGNPYNVGSGVSHMAAASGTPYVEIDPNAPNSGYRQCANSAGTVTCIFESQINLGGSDVTGVLGLGGGGTNATSAANALINLLGSPLNGQFPIGSSGNWILAPKCAVSTCIPGFTGGGVMNFIQTPMPPVDGGTGLGTMTQYGVYVGNNASAMILSSIQDNTVDVIVGEPIIGKNSVQLTSPTTITSTSLITTGLALPAVPSSTTISGHCSLIWEQSTGASTVTFGIGMNNAPTDLWVAPPTIWNGTAVAFGGYTTITGTSATNITSTITPAATATGYKLEFDFTVKMGLNTGIVTVYGLTANGSDALVIEPGSFCAYHP